LSFNISQIINKFLPTRPHSSSADGWENPFQTGSGQLVASVNETWQSRLARMGGMNQSNAVKVSCPKDANTSVLNIRPPQGRNAFLTHVIISADGAGVAFIGGMSKYITAGGSFEMKFDGAYMVDYEVTCKFKADNDATTATASAMWLEVTL